MTSVSTSISVGWPISTGLKVDIRADGPKQTAILSWDNVTNSYISGLDPSNNGGFNTIYWRVAIGSNTYLVYNNPTFEMSIPFVGASGNCKTCVKVQTIYDLSSNSYAPNTNLATSDWSQEVCFNNRPDLYCQSRVKNTTVTQNYGSMNMRYSRAIKMGRFGSSRGAAAYSFYK